MHKIAATLLPILMIMAPFAHAQETTTEAPLLSASALDETLPAEASPATDAAGAPESAGEPAPQDAVPPVDAPAAGGSAGDTQPADSEGPAPALEDVSAGAASSTPIQDTANTQDTVDADVLQGADNPEELATTTVAVDASATDATSSPVTLDASSTPEIITLDADGALDIVAEDVQPTDAAQDPEPQPETQPEQQPDNPPVPETALSVADLAPKPEYSFAMTGKRIEAKRIVRDRAGKEQVTDVTQAVTPEIDNATGSMQVSGSCSNTYFVVLLFKNQDDYVRDPKSYLIDKAFPCVGGAFSYRIADLPDSIQDGTYYLLIGEEGERGPWAALTDLTEVTISRNQ